MKDRRREGSQYSGLRTSGVLLSIPTLLIVAPLVGFFGGFWLDRWLRTSPGSASWGWSWASSPPAAKPT